MTLTPHERENLSSKSNQSIDTIYRERLQLQKERSLFEKDLKKLETSQSHFETKVKEMGVLFERIKKEKEALQRDKQLLRHIIVSKETEISTFRAEIQAIKKDAEALKANVQSTVEKEVKRIVYRKFIDKDRVCDYPL